MFNDAQSPACYLRNCDRERKMESSTHRIYDRQVHIHRVASNNYRKLERKTKVQSLMNDKKQFLRQTVMTKIKNDTSEIDPTILDLVCAL